MQLEFHNEQKQNNFLANKVYDQNLLAKTCMDLESKTIFNVVGWQGFWSIHEGRSRLLTLEFLCSLQTSRDEISFLMFKQDYHLTWSEVNVALGFDVNCSLNLEHATHVFNKDEFWEAITNLDNCEHLRPNEIHNPTLRFLHHWIGMTLFPRSDVRTLRNDDLSCCMLWFTRFLFLLSKIWFLIGKVYLEELDPLSLHL